MKYEVIHFLNGGAEVRTFALKGPAFAFAKRHAPTQPNIIQITEKRASPSGWKSTQHWNISPNGLVVSRRAKAA